MNLLLKFGLQKESYNNIAKLYNDYFCDIYSSTKGKITYPAGITLPNSLIFMDCASNSVSNSVSNSTPISTPSSTAESAPNSAPFVPKGPFVTLVCVSLSLCASMLFRC